MENKGIKNHEGDTSSLSALWVGVMVGGVLGGYLGVAVWLANVGSRITVNLKKNAIVLPTGASSIVTPVLVPSRR